MRLSFLDCLREDGVLDPSRFFQFLRNCRDRDLSIIDSIDLMMVGRRSHDSDGLAQLPASREPRSRAPRFVYARKDSENGPLVIITPEESLWYKMYVSNFYLLESSCMQEKFRVRFRLPYPNFRELVEWVSADPLFDRWCGWKSNNKKASPVELLVLGALRYLGRGWTFDDIEECTAISKEVHRIFFHKFILFGSTELYCRMVTAPISVDEAFSHMAEYKSAGLPGCIGSIDCTHIVTERCEYNL